MKRFLVPLVLFIGLAIFYTVTMSRGRVDWILAISGPMFLVGVLFLWGSFQGITRRAA